MGDVPGILCPEGFLHEAGDGFIRRQTFGRSKTVSVSPISFAPILTPSLGTALRGLDIPGLRTLVPPQSRITTVSPRLWK
jgi:hypothetical protein